jgi:hypothetical protein
LKKKISKIQQNNAKIISITTKISPYLLIHKIIKNTKLNKNTEKKTKNNAKKIQKKKEKRMKNTYINGVLDFSS